MSFIVANQPPTLPGMEKSSAAPFPSELRFQEEGCEEVVKGRRIVRWRRWRRRRRGRRRKSWMLWEGFGKGCSSKMASGLAAVTPEVNI